MPVRRPAAPDRRAGRRAVGRRCAPDRRRRRHHRGRRHVHARRRRAGDEHVDRGRARQPQPAGHPLRQDPPLRRVRVHRVADRRARPRAGGDHGRRRRGGLVDLLRHPLSRALHRAGAAGRPGDRRLRVVGGGPRQTRAVDAAGPGPRAGLHELRRGGRSGRPRRRPDRLGRAHGRGRQPGGLAVRRGGRVRRPAPATGGRRHRHRPGGRGPREHRGAAQPLRVCSGR